MNSSQHYIKVVDSFDEVVKIKDENEFLATILIYPHSAITFQNNKRNETCFKDAKAVIIDFDNKNGHKAPSIEGFLESDFASRYNFIVYTSKSHTEDKHCYHVYIPLSETISTKNQYRQLLKGLEKYFEGEGLTLDKQATNSASRYFNPSRHCGEKPIEALKRFEYVFENDNIDLNPNDYYIEESIQNQNTDLYKSETPESRFFHSLVFEEQKNSIIAFYNLLSHHNQELNYRDWMRLGASAFNLFGKDIGWVLFRIVSQNYIKKDGTIESETEIRDVYERILRSKNTVCGFSYIIKLGLRFRIVIRPIFAKTVTDRILAKCGNMVFKRWQAFQCKKMNVHSCKLYFKNRFQNFRERSFLLISTSEDGIEAFHTIKIKEIKLDLQKMTGEDASFIGSEIVRIFRNNSLPIPEDFYNSLVQEVRSNKVIKQSTNETVVTSKVFRTIHDKIIKKYLLNKRTYNRKLIEKVLESNGIFETHYPVRNRLNGKVTTYYKLTNTLKDAITIQV